MRWISLFPILFLSGCLGLMPGVSGKSHYSVDFVDTVTAEGGQNTEFHSDISAPAGDIAKIDPGATYRWDESTGEFSVSGKGSIDSTAQAAMVTEVSKQQLEAFTSGLNTALNVLAPFLGQKLQSDDNQAAIKAETEAEKLRAAIALVEAEMAKRTTNQVEK